MKKWVVIFSLCLIAGLVTLLLSGCGCDRGIKTTSEVLERVEVGMTKGQVYDVVDVQYFRDNESFLGVIISEIMVTKKGRVFDFTVGDSYNRLYYGYFFFDVVADSDVALVVFGWNDNSVTATGEVPFTRVQEIAEEKYGRPFRR